MANFNRRVFMGIAVGTVFVPSLLLAGGRTPNEQSHTVEITGFKFVPATLSVRPGDKIRWINRDIAPHTATAVDESWDTGTLEKGASVVTVVGGAIAEKYFCRFHPHMTAELKLTHE
jgi:plastocyanin